MAQPPVRKADRLETIFNRKMFPELHKIPAHILNKYSSKQVCLNVIYTTLLHSKQLSRCRYSHLISEISSIKTSLRETKSKLDSSILSNEKLTNHILTLSREIGSLKTELQLKNDGLLTSQNATPPIHSIPPSAAISDCLLPNINSPEPFDISMDELTNLLSANTSPIPRQIPLYLRTSLNLD